MARFHLKVSIVSTMTSDLGPHLTEFEIVMMFLQKLERYVSNRCQRTTIFGHKKDFQACADTSRSLKRLTSVQIKRVELEYLITCKMFGTIDHPTRVYPRRNTATGRVQTNVIAISMNRLTYFKYGQVYKLSACLEASHE